MERRATASQGERKPARAIGRPQGCARTIHELEPKPGRPQGCARTIHGRRAFSSSCIVRAHPCGRPGSRRAVALPAVARSPLACSSIFQKITAHFARYLIGNIFLKPLLIWVHRIIFFHMVRQVFFTSSFHDLIFSFFGSYNGSFITVAPYRTPNICTSTRVPGTAYSLGR